MSEARTNQVSEYLDRVRQLDPLIRSNAAESERNAQLSSAVAEAFHDNGLFRIFLPADVGGGGLTIPEGLRVFEETAKSDGSAGWNLAICAGAALAANFITREAFERIFKNPRAVIVGSLNPTARAVKCSGGFRFSGKATYASGCAQASWLTASAIVLEDGKPQFAGNMPIIRVGLFPMKECRILDTWSVSGMRGTGSHDCTFENVFVPESYVCEFPDPRSPWLRGPLAAIPLATQLGGTLAAVALGVARHAIDSLKALAGGKVPAASLSTLRDRPMAQIQLAQAEGLLRAARAYLYDAIDEVWRRGERDEQFDSTARADARLAHVTAVKLAAQAVDLVYDAGGITSMQTSFDIERCWRDAHAITQHVIVSTGRYEVIGRVLMGLDPGSPII